MKQTRCIPPPATVTRFPPVPAFFDTRDTLTPNFFYSPYSVLCTLSSTYNKSQRMSMDFYKPDMRLSFKKYSTCYDIYYTFTTKKNAKT